MTMIDVIPALDRVMSASRLMFPPKNVIVTAPETAGAHWNVP